MNTWSVDGFISEGCQPAELGWGSHEKELPHDGAHHTFGSDAAIYLNRPGCLTKVRTWTPTEHEFHGKCLTTLSTDNSVTPALLANTLLEDADDGHS